MKFRDKIYIIVPSTLLGLTLIVLILNNYIISYLPPNILLVYPLKPCWPSDGFFIGGPGMTGIRDMQFFNEKPSYRVGEIINLNMVYTTTHDIFTPSIYIKDSKNQIVWKYDGRTLKNGCGLTLHYNLQDMTEPPRIDLPGQYTMYAVGSFTDKITSFQFNVVP